LELGGLGVGLQRVGGDHHVGEVEPVQQRAEGAHLLGCAADLALGQHRTAGVIHRRQQVHRAAVTVGWVGAAQRLAVDGHRPPPAGPGRTGVPVPVGQRVWFQAGKGPADGGLGGDGEVVGGVAAGTHRGPDVLGRIGGPFGDRGDRPGAGQYRGGGQAQDGNQRVAPATVGGGVGDAASARAASLASSAALAVPAQHRHGQGPGPLR
jgi:hypothetical protein